MDYVKHFEKTVRLDKKEGIATITFCCPENQNKMNDQWLAEYDAALTSASEDLEVKVILLKSEGEFFMGSGDVQNYLLPVLCKNLAEANRAMYRTGNVVRKMYRCRQPIIACMNGKAEGGGAGITLNADLIIASEQASFNLGIFGRAGLAPDSGGLWALQRLVGPMRAKQLVWSQDWLSAQEALELGIVARVVSSDDIDAEVDAFARYIADLPPLGVAAVKQISNRMPEYSLDTYLQQEAEYISHGLFSKDYTEMKTALAEGRKPVYVGA